MRISGGPGCNKNCELARVRSEKLTVVCEEATPARVGQAFSRVSAPPVHGLTAVCEEATPARVGQAFSRVSAPPVHDPTASSPHARGGLCSDGAAQRGRSDHNWGAPIALPPARGGQAVWEGLGRSART